jgi:hypothetical protein
MCTTPVHVRLGYIVDPLATVAPELMDPPHEFLTVIVQVAPGTAMLKLKAMSWYVLFTRKNLAVREWLEPIGVIDVIGKSSATFALYEFAAVGGPTWEI